VIPSIDSFAAKARRRGAPVLALLLAAASPALPAPVQADPNAVEPEVIRLNPIEAPPPPGSAAAAPAVSGAAVSRAPVNSREVLINQFWFAHQNLVKRGAAKEAGALVDQAVGFMEREGLRASPEIGAAFLAGARRARRDGEVESALEQVRLALRFDPGRSDARFTLAGLLLRNGDLAGGLRALRDGLFSLLRDPEQMFYLAGGALSILYLGACAGLGVAVVLIGLRTRPAFVHDLEERLTGRVPRAAAAFLGTAILALPLLLPVPFGWTLAFWGAVLFAWVEPGERLVIAASLGLLLLAGLFGAAVTWHAETATDPVARALLQAARAGADQRHEAPLLAAAQEHPDDPIYPFLLGTAYRVGGRPDEATAMYQQVLDRNPSNARAMVNLGNLHALRQEFSVAQALYKKASDLDPSLLEAFYDSHLAFLETFNMEAADQALVAARRVDEARVDRLLNGSGPGAAHRSPQDAAWPEREIVARALRLKQPGGPQGVLRAMALNPTAAGAFAGLLAAILVPGLLLAPHGPRASRCRRCGRAYCRRCQMMTKFEDHCAQCVHLFLLRDGLAPKVREDKLGEVVRYRRRVFLRTRILSLVLPGSGQMMGGRALLGALLLAGWGIALGGFLLRRQLLAPPGRIESSVLAPGTAASLLIGLLVWLFANLTRQEAAD
jgi:tetratricopeptide (TPR) repeat protein